MFETFVLRLYQLKSLFQRGRIGKTQLYNDNSRFIRYCIFFFKNSILQYIGCHSRYKNGHLVYPVHLVDWCWVCFNKFNIYQMSYQIYAITFGGIVLSPLMLPAVSKVDFLRLLNKIKGYALNNRSIYPQFCSFVSYVDSF